MGDEELSMALSPGQTMQCAVHSRECPVHPKYVDGSAGRTCKRPRTEVSESDTLPDSLYINGPIALNNFVLAFPHSCPRPFPENSFSSRVTSQRTIQYRKPQSRSGQPSANTFPFQHQSLGPKAAIAAVIKNSCLDKPDSINSFNESLPKNAF